MPEACQVTWNCCPDSQKPDLSPYDAFELAGCVEYEPGAYERVEESEEADIFTLYGHLRGGGCECLHDWPEGFKDIDAIREEAERVAAAEGLPLWDMIGE